MNKFIITKILDEEPNIEEIKSEQIESKKLDIPEIVISIDDEDFLYQFEREETGIDFAGEFTGNDYVGELKHYEYEYYVPGKIRDYDTVVNDMSDFLNIKPEELTQEDVDNILDKKVDTSNLVFDTFDEFVFDKYYDEIENDINYNIDKLDSDWFNWEEE